MIHEESLKDLKLNRSEFEKQFREIAPADKCYMIIFTPRSGSSWLTSILSSTNVFGYPEEYINPGFIRNVATSMNTTDPQELLASLKRRRKTDNGVFGIQATSTHIEMFGKEVFFRQFDRSQYHFNLWRNNIVSQGISLFKAVSTNRFHSNSHAGESEPVYNAEQIKRWINHIFHIENNNVKLIAEYLQNVVHLRYETLVTDREVAIATFADTVGVKISGKIGSSDPLKTDLKKIGNHWNSNAERRFRVEEASFVEEMQGTRLIERLQPKFDLAIPSKIPPHTDM